MSVAPGKSEVNAAPDISQFRRSGERDSAEDSCESTAGTIGV